MGPTPGLEYPTDTAEELRPYRLIFNTPCQGHCGAPRQFGPMSTRLVGQGQQRMPVVPRPIDYADGHGWRSGPKRLNIIPGPLRRNLTQTIQVG